MPAFGQDQASLTVTIHVVQRGETLFRIAQQYGLTVDELAQLNSLSDPGSIQVGQRLLVPTNSEVAPTLHTIQPGETLRTIAQRYAVTVTELAEWNAIDNIDAIYAGQQIQVSPPSQTISPEPERTDEAADVPTVEPTATPLTVAENSADVTEPSIVVHVVQRGELLGRISQQYNVSVNTIVQANGIADPETIYAGQQLIIPGVDAPELASDLPAPLTRIDVMPLILIEGQTARFRVHASTPVTLTGTFLDKSLSVGASDGTILTMLTAIPLGTAGGVYPLALQVNDGESVTINIQVVPGVFGRERIRLLEGRDELLDNSVETAELTVLRGVMSRFNPDRYFDGAMGLPAAAVMNSPFGSTRSYNGGEFTRVHTGADFAGIPGTPIIAPASGYVVLADDLNVRGTATVIDHGWGVYSGYWHQSARYVGVGDYVEVGQVIGAVGSSGRVSGPHLHWELWVNGTPVDPMQWVRLSFS